MSDKRNVTKGAEEGHFIDLEHAEMGKVVTRFPPEPSGYLHIGHAKAALLNDYFARRYEGKLILRFDDTNPSKEKQEFVDNIIADLRALEIVEDRVTYTSDYFPQMLEYAESMIKKGQAYCDDTPVDEMREQRLARKRNKNFDNTVEENLAMWKEMLNGSEKGLQTCLRAKMFIDSKNGCLRDPTIYRCNDTPHHKTGTKYKVYPLYDFACPIVDSIEGVTHALRSSEYTDRNPQYEWFLKTLDLRHVNIWEFSRLNFQFTLLSKRKLQWFVDNKLVESWADPRFPTVQGLRRHGLTVEALRLFILSQGASRNANLMAWEKIWTINKKVIDPIAPRFRAFDKNSMTPLFLSGEGTMEEVECKSIDRHPKNPEVGKKMLRYYKNLWLDTVDANDLSPGEEVTLMTWGNCIIESVDKDDSGKVLGVSGKLHLEGDFKKTKKKLTWLVNHPDELLTSVKFVEIDHLLTKKSLEETDKFEEFINPDSRKEFVGLGEADLRLAKINEHIQIERRGYYVVDRPYISEDKPLVLVSIPDGRAAKPEPGERERVVAEKVAKKNEDREKAAAEKEAKRLEKERKKAEKEKKKAEKKAKKAAAAAAGGDAAAEPAEGAPATKPAEEE